MEANLFVILTNGEGGTPLICTDLLKPLVDGVVFASTTGTDLAIVSLSMTIRRVALCALLLLVAACPAAAQPPDPVRTITAVRGNLYRAQDGPRVTVFRVDDDGIVLVDPMSRNVAGWLQQQFDERFPGRPVKYVVYSGLDLERVGGASVFDRTADVIAHETFNERSQAVRERTPELGEGVLFAESRFASRRTLFDGDSAIDLVYPGPAAVTAQVLVFFRRERLLFASAHPALSAPFSNRDVRPAVVAQWIAAVSEVEFDLLLDGRGDTATRADVTAADSYARAVMAGMKDASARGLSVTQLQGSTSIGRFEGTPFAKVRDADIAALYRRTSVLLLDAFGAALANRVPEDTLICEDVSCRPTTGAGFLVGAGFSIAHLKMSVEFSSGTAVDIAVDRSFTLHGRQRHVTFLAGGRIGPRSGINVTLLGGFRHADNVYRAQLVSGLRFHDTSRGNALAFGGDVVAPLSGNMALVIPFRFTPSHGVFGAEGNGLDIRAGVGLSFTYHRRAM